MFEIGIFCVILFALAYWATLFIMGRREDVLHGEFVEPEPQSASAPVGTPMSAPSRSPAQADLPAPSRSSRQSQRLLTIAAPRAVAGGRKRAEEAGQCGSAAALLVSIKQELKNAAQI